MVAGKQQRDPVTGALLYLTLPTVAIEFDTNCDYTWGVGNGILNATSNLLTNCWGALTKKDAWLGKKYHISSCSTEVSGVLFPEGTQHGVCSMAVATLSTLQEPIKPTAFVLSLASHC
jgi:hypothetical protein